MATAKVTLESVSPYSQGKHISEEKEEQESDQDLERRCWRGRLHVNEDGYVYIPPMAFKNCLSDAAKYMSMQIKGKGKATYTKHFEAGVLVVDPLVLPIKKEDVKGEWMFVPSNGQRGGGKRVDKCFPVIPTWTGEVTFYVLDNTITEEIFTSHLEQAGKFIGIGRFRPRNNGFYGRFMIKKIKWSK